MNTVCFIVHLRFTQVRFTALRFDSCFRGPGSLYYVSKVVTQYQIPIRVLCWRPPAVPAAASQRACAAGFRVRL
eukprot:4258363-Prymnesium_polylepis.1